MMGLVIVLWVACTLLTAMCCYIKQYSLPFKTNEAVAAFSVVVSVLGPVTIVVITVVKLYRAVLYLGRGFHDLWTEFFPRPKLPRASTRPRRQNGS